MRILFIHRGFPGQFGGLGRWLATRGWDVTFATQKAGARDPLMRVLRFQSAGGRAHGLDPALAPMEEALRASRGMAQLAGQMRARGYRPDIVVAHSGWGVGAMVKDVWPGAVYLPYLEWYYRPGRGQSAEARARTRLRNGPTWMDLAVADATICPTEYQAGRFPRGTARNIKILRDGIDTGRITPGPVNAALMQRLGLPAHAEIITYVARGLEPLRGFPQAMAAIARVLRLRPGARAVIVGQDRVAYGPQDGPWRDRVMAECGADPARVHFPGLLPHAQLIDLLRASDVHLYLSAPFILSWSLLEAMALAVPIVAADNAPVQEAIADGCEGFLVDPRDTDEVVTAVISLLEDRQGAAALGRAARARIVQEWDAWNVAYPAFERFALAQLRRSARRRQERMGPRAGAA